MKPGIYEKIPFAEYLKIDAFSKSMVGPILKSPKHLRYEQEQGVEPNSRMDFGSLVDCLLLEPDTFAARFRILPETYTDSKGKEKLFTLQSNTCRETLDSIRAANLIPVKAADMETANNIIAEIKKHPTAAAILDGCKTQVTVIWIDPETGILCKGRFDIFKPDRFADLKVTDNPHPGAFSRIANSMGYHVQAAMYHNGYICATTGKYPEDNEWKIPFSFIAAESAPPHDIVCYNLDDNGTFESLTVGFEKFKKAVRVYAECKATDEWPGYSNAAESLGIPQWAKNQLLLEGVYE